MTYPVINQISRKEPQYPCKHCKQRFDQAGKKFIHQREVHGDMEGWLTDEEIAAYKGEGI